MKYISLLLLLVSSSVVMASEVKVEKFELTVSDETLENCKKDALEQKARVHHYTCKVSLPEGYISLGLAKMDELSFEYTSYYDVEDPFEREDAWITARVNGVSDGIKIELQTHSQHMSGPYKSFTRQSKINAFDKLKDDLSEVKLTYIVVKQ